MKKYIKWGLLLVWMVIIFAFSAQNGNGSQNISDGLLHRLTDVFPLFDLDFLGIETGILIRKLAHFGEYFILALLIYWCFGDLKLKNRYLLSFCSALLYAFFDEVHQLFVEGRNFAFGDIVIDGMGILLALGLVLIISRLLDEKN